MWIRYSYLLVDCSIYLLHCKCACKCAVLLHLETAFQSISALSLVVLNHHNENNFQLGTRSLWMWAAFLLCSQDSCWSLFTWPFNLTWRCRSQPYQGNHQQLQLMQPFYNAWSMIHIYHIEGWPQWFLIPVLYLQQGVSISLRLPLHFCVCPLFIFSLLLAVWPLLLLLFYLQVSWGTKIRKCPILSPASPVLLQITGCSIGGSSQKSEGENNINSQNVLRLLNFSYFIQPYSHPSQILIYQELNYRAARQIPPRLSTRLVSTLYTLYESNPSKFSHWVSRILFSEKKILELESHGSLNHRP